MRPRHTSASDEEKSRRLRLFRNIAGEQEVVGVFLGDAGDKFAGVLD